MELGYNNNPGLDGRWDGEDKRKRRGIIYFFFFCCFLSRRGESLIFRSQQRGEGEGEGGEAIRGDILSPLCLPRCVCEAEAVFVWCGCVCLWALARIARFQAMLSRIISNFPDFFCRWRTSAAASLSCIPLCVRQRRGDALMSDWAELARSLLLPPPPLCGPLGLLEKPRPRSSGAPRCTAEATGRRAPRLRGCVEQEGGGGSGGGGGWEALWACMPMGSSMHSSCVRHSRPVAEAWTASPSWGDALRAVSCWFQNEEPVFYILN